VSFRDSSVTVFRKSREWKEASLPEPVITPLKRYAKVLNVPESWPVFTTLHRPSLASYVTKGLADPGLDDDAIERIREGAPDLIVAAEYGLDALKPLTTEGARSIMERLWTHDALADRRNELDLSLDGGYLELHGGRRGVGGVLVRQFGYAAAAQYLDNSEEQVREAYQRIEAAERADMVTEAFSQTDQRISDR